MINLRFKISTFLLGLSLGITGIKAEISVKEAFQNDKAYKYLRETKDIEAIEISPDNRHLLLSYFTPTIDNPPEGKKGDWLYTFIIKNNYAAKNSQVMPFNSDKFIYSSVWMPDSKRVSYISQGDKVPSIWVSPAHDFKPKKILELDNDIIAYKWSPNGKKLAVWVKQEEPGAIKFVPGVDRKLLKTLYVADINDKMEASNVTLLASDKHLPLEYNDEGYVLRLSWTPDSQHITYSYYPVSKGKETEFAQIDLIHVTTKKATTLAKGEGTNLFPQISPDGKYLAYITNILPENAKNPIRVYGMDASRTCLINLVTYQKQCLAKTPNENPKLVGWKKDGQSLFVIDQEGLATQVYELSLDGETIHKFTKGEQTLGKVRISASGDYIAYVAQNIQTPSEVYITPIDHFNPKNVTSFSNSNSLNLSFEKTNVYWSSQDKKFDLEGMLIFSKSHPPEKPMPLITILNDYLAPSLALSYAGDLGNYPISLLSLINKGYGVFIPIRRGENGYGVQFRQAIYKDLGGQDFQDVMGGIDALTKTKKIDPNKLALWGWGYGGYLSAWALTQTDRFKTIIAGSGIANLVSHYGTTNNSSLLKAMMGGPFWKDWKTWREKSPISHVKSMKTPTFIQAGKDDSVVDSSQSEELYFPLKSREIPTQMIMYKDQGHLFEGPNTIFLAIQDLESWLEKYFSAQSKTEEKERH